MYIGELCRYLLNTKPSEYDQKHKVENLSLYRVGLIVIRFDWASAMGCDLKCGLSLSTASTSPTYASSTVGTFTAYLS